MNRAEVAKALAVLKAVWTDRTVNAETVTAYEMALSDIPAELGMGAVAEHMRTGKFFPAPSEIRALAMQRGTGMPSAEQAWDEVRRAISAVGMYGNPRWSTAALEQTVRTLGWRSICVCEEDNIGTLRAQFRNTYDRYAQAVVAGDAAPALADAGRRRAALEEAKRPLALTHLRPLAALPESAEAEPAKAPGVPYALMKQRKRFAAQHPHQSGDPKPDTLGVLQNLPTWNNLSEEYRARLLAEHEARKSDAS